MVVCPKSQQTLIYLKLRTKTKIKMTTNAIS